MTSINLNFLNSKEISVLYSYEFIKNYLTGRVNDGQFFCGNLEVYREEMISRGINRNILNFLKFLANPSERLKSRNDWKTYWESQGYTWGTTILWHQERISRLFKMPRIGNKVVRAVMEGYLELIEELGLNFKISYLGEHESTINQVKKCTMTNGKIDSMELHINLYKEPWRNKLYGGVQHGDVTIVDSLLNVSGSWWGATHFDFGSCVISVPPDKQSNLSFIKNVAKHEATHMFGYHLHHDDIDVKGYIFSAKDCLTFHRCSTLKLCVRCKDAITEYWKGVQERTGKPYFK